MNTATVRRDGPASGTLAYTIDGQGRVFRVREAIPPDVPTARADAARTRERS